MKNVSKFTIQKVVATTMCKWFAKPSSILLLLLLFALPITSFGQNSSSVSTDSTVTRDNETAKISTSSKFSYKKMTPNTYGITDFYKISMPKQGKLIKRRLKANGTSVKDFVETNFPGYMYVWHQGQKFCNYIIVLDKSKVESFSVANSKESLLAMRLLARLSTEKLPRVIPTYQTLSELITTAHNAKKAIKYAPNDAMRFKAKLNYLCFAKNMEEVSRMANNIAKRNDAMKEQLICTACLKSQFIKSTADFKYYTDELGCNPKSAAQYLIANLSCGELLSVSDSIPAAAREIYLHEIECHVAGCIQSISDWHRYKAVYSIKGACMKKAFNQAVIIATREERLWELLEKNKILAEEFANDIKNTAKNALSNRKSLSSYHTIWNTEQDLRFGFKFAMDNFEIDDVQGLILENIYDDVEEFVTSTILTRAKTNLDWANFYLNQFTLDTNGRKEAYRYAINLTSDKEQKNRLVKEYIKEYQGKGLETISKDIECSTAYQLVEEDKRLVVELYSICLECVVNLDTFILFAQTYDPSDAFDRIQRKLSAKDLRGIHKEFSGLRPQIMEAYLEKTENVDDIDWCLDNYPDHPLRQDASERGLSFAFSQYKRGEILTKRVADHVREFGLDLILVDRFINCDQMLQFLSLVKSATWIDDMVTSSLKCVDDNNLDRYKTIFGHLPEFQNKIIEGVYSDLTDVEASKIITDIPVLEAGQSKEIVITMENINNPILVLQDYQKNLQIEIIIDGKPSNNTFSKENLILHSFEKIGTITVRATNTNSGGIFNNSSTNRVAIVIHDCPPMLWSHISYMIGNEQSRKMFIKACNQLFDDIEKNKTTESYETIIGARFQKIVNESAMEGASRDIALKTAGLFLNITNPYLPKGRLQRMTELVGEFTEKTLREWTRA